MTTSEETQLRARVQELERERDEALTAAKKIEEQADHLLQHLQDRHDCSCELEFLFEKVGASAIPMPSNAAGRKCAICEQEATEIDEAPAAPEGVRGERLTCSNGHTWFVYGPFRIENFKRVSGFLQRFDQTKDKP